MKAVKAADLRNRMKDIFDRVAGGETVIIPRPHSKNVVVVSEDEWNELMRAKKNADYLTMLDSALAEYESGKVISKGMDELDALANGYCRLYADRMGTYTEWIALDKLAQRR